MGLLAGKVIRLCHLGSQVSPICESPSLSAPGHLHAVWSELGCWARQTERDHLDPCSLSRAMASFFSL